MYRRCLPDTHAHTHIHTFMFIFYVTVPPTPSMFYYYFGKCRRPRSFGFDQHNNNNMICTHNGGAPTNWNTVVLRDAEPGFFCFLLYNIFTHSILYMHMLCQKCAASHHMYVKYLVQHWISPIENMLFTIPCVSLKYFLFRSPDHYSLGQKVYEQNIRLLLTMVSVLHMVVVDYDRTWV